MLDTVSITSSNSLASIDPTSIGKQYIQPLQVIRVTWTNFLIFSVNSVYGKFGENVLKQTEQEVVYDQASFNKNVLSPYYKSHKILNENLVIVEKYKDFVSLNKPVQIASAILELAKFTMYNYYYNVLLPAYNNRVELVYTDTDR